MKKHLMLKLTNYPFIGTLNDSTYYILIFAIKSKLWRENL